MGTDNQQASLCELSWLGGIIDGEGCITLLRKARAGGKVCATPYILITNTDRTLIDKVAAIFENCGLPFYFETYESTKNWKTRYRVIVAGFLRVTKVLPVIRPYLVSKIRQADAVLDLIKIRAQKPTGAPYDDAEVDICNFVWSLNNRGPVDWSIGRSHKSPNEQTRKAAGQDVLWSRGKPREASEMSARH